MTPAEFLSTLAIALGLSADCFAVAVSSSISKRDHSLLDRWRVSSSFGLFQAIMTALGWKAGTTVVELIGKYDHWVAFILLALIGGRMLWESRKRGHEEAREVDNTRGFVLLILSLATSMDALAVGLSFAFLRVNILSASLIIGAVAFLVSMTGFVIGRKSGQLIGKRAELIGGIILIAIGLRILLGHLL
ncbi:MAG: manganese efflux pump MntP family protein [Dehalococcoidales bacterium]|nr:manganese efflux pump MntP family protein [Dehalococcoidales bacterium]